MSRLLNNALSVNFLRKDLGFINVFKAVKFDLRLIVLDKFTYKNVLVLAPHPDDDAIGMGGTIKKITTAGAKVIVAYFCDGAGGVAGAKPLETEVGVLPKRDENLIEIRKNEALESGKILGVTQSYFWGYRDGQLAAGTSAIKALGDLITSSKPDIIFLPSFLDNHADHRVTNEIFFNASRNILTDDFPVWAYEVWTPVFVNRLIDITLYIKTKGEAIQVHASQSANRAFDKAMTGLNQYRADMNGLSGYAEAYFSAPLKLYRELYQKS